MKNSIQVFPDLEYVLNPQVNFTGDYLFVDKIFRACQKGHAYDDFIKKEYLDPLDKLFGHSAVGDLILIFFHNYPLENGRVTTLNANLYLGQQAETMLGEHVPTELDSTEEVISWCREKARSTRREIKSYLRGESPSYPSFLNHMYEYNKAAYDEMHKGRRFYPPLTIKMFLEKYSESLGEYLTALRSAEAIFNKPLDIAALSKTVDVDKCVLALAKAAFESSKIIEAEQHQLHNSFIISYNVKNVLERVKQKYPKYRLSTTFYDIVGEPTYHYTLEQFIQEIDDTLARHPEYRAYEVTVDDGKDYRNLETVQALEKEIIDRETVRELSGSWEFLPKGERVQDLREITSTKGEKSSTPGSEPTGLAALDDGALLQDVAARYAYLESKNYLYNIKGKNNFEGYVGYIYPNGIVLFEKLYESIDPLIPARSNATYVMSVDNFVQMSRLSKPEIIEYIKAGGNDARRIYHSKNPGRWEEKMESVIEGKGYSDATLDIIDAILKSGELKQENDGLESGTGGRR